MDPVAVLAGCRRRRTAADSSCRNPHGRSVDAGTRAVRAERITLRPSDRCDHPPRLENHNGARRNPRAGAATQEHSAYPIPETAEQMGSTSYEETEFR